MAESYDYDTENETRCLYCGSFDIQWISGHVLRCGQCGSMWCESCSD